MINNFETQPNTKSPEEDLKEKKEQWENKKNKDFFEFLNTEKIIFESEDGKTICDTEKIKALNKKELRDNGMSLTQGKGEDRFSFDWSKVLLNFSKDKKFYSIDDYEKINSVENSEEVEPKSLFYIAEKEEAFDIEKIKQSNFHLSISDLNVRWASLDKYFEEKLGYDEKEAEAVEIALRVYHSKYGNGYRNESDELFVKKDINSEDEEYQKISAEWLVKNSEIKRRSIGQKGNQKIAWTSPREALIEKEYRILAESGLLKEEDFKSVFSPIFRRESIIGKKGQVYLENAKYNLGAEFENKKLIKLEDDLYGIVDNIKGYEKITHFFHPIDLEIIEQKKKDFLEKHGRIHTSTSNIFVNKSEINIIPYKETEINKIRQDESAEEYADRIPTTIKNYNLLKQFSKDLSKEAEIGIHNLSLKEQAWLAEYAYSVEEKYDRVIEFSKKFGLEGLKSFIACEYGEQNGDKILEIADKIEKENAQEIFSKYAQTLEKISGINSDIKDFFENENNEKLKYFPNHFEEAVRRRTSDLFLASHYLLKSDSENFEIKDANLSLISVNTFLEIMGDLKNKELYDFKLEIDDKSKNPDNVTENNCQYFVRNKKTGLEYRLRTFIRPNGGSRGEARISFTLAFEGNGINNENKELKDFFKQQVEHTGQKLRKQKSEFSIRIDRDTHYKPPKISLDLGRNKYEDEKIKRSGDKLGNLLNATTELGSHNIKSFNQDYANEDLFAELSEILYNFLRESQT